MRKIIATALTVLAIAGCGPGNRLGGGGAEHGVTREDRGKTMYEINKEWNKRNPTLKQLPEQ